MGTFICLTRVYEPEECRLPKHRLKSTANSRASNGPQKKFWGAKGSLPAGRLAFAEREFNPLDHESIFIRWHGFDKNVGVQAAFGLALAIAANRPGMDELIASSSSSHRPRGLDPPNLPDNLFESPLIFVAFGVEHVPPIPVGLGGLGRV